MDDLYDFLYREYHPVQGRWISPDPARLGTVDLTNPQTWNRYAYVINDPLALTDPLGLSGGCPPNMHPATGIVAAAQTYLDQGRGLLYGRPYVCNSFATHMISNAGYCGITVPKPSELGTGAAIVPFAGGALVQVNNAAAEPGDILVMHAPGQKDPGYGHVGIVTGPGPSWTFVGAQSGRYGVSNVNPAADMKFENPGLYADWVKTINANHPKVYRVCLPDGSSIGNTEKGSSSLGGSLHSVTVSSVYPWMGAGIGDESQSSDSASSSDNAPSGNESSVHSILSGCTDMAGAACNPPSDTDPTSTGAGNGGCPSTADCPS
jgi:RHS repeat-associated protein